MGCNSLRMMKNRHVAPWDVHCLTPTKLATFYRLVGGDYDPLFLDTPQSSLSFIYQSLGCFHTLQPDRDPHSAPSIPALTPQGFVRWQTVQLLLEPDEHAPFLQNAVKRFEITNPADGEPFPSILPREALPSKPDPQMLEWHDNVSEKLMIEAQVSSKRVLPPRPPMALGDGRQTERSRPLLEERKPLVCPLEKPSANGAPLPNSHTPKSSQGYQTAPPASHPYQRSKVQGSARPIHPQPAYDGPWSPLRRRSSMPLNQSHQSAKESSWAYVQGFSQGKNQHHIHPRQPQPISHARTASSLSTSSYTSESSYTTSSASMSPVLSPTTPLHPAVSAPPNFNRRHSTYHPQPIRPYNQAPTFLDKYHQRGISGERNFSLPPSSVNISHGIHTNTFPIIKPTAVAHNPPIVHHPPVISQNAGVSTAAISKEQPRVHRSSTVKGPTLRPEVVTTTKKDMRHARSADGRWANTREQTRTRDQAQERGRSVGGGTKYRDEPVAHGWQ